MLVSPVATAAVEYIYALPSIDRHCQPVLISCQGGDIGVEACTNAAIWDAVSCRLGGTCGCCNTWVLQDDLVVGHK